MTKTTLPSGWENTMLHEVLSERSDTKGNRNIEICSVAVNAGVVNQMQHLGRSYAASDTSNYNVVSYGDMVYTKSPTGDFPLGIVKQSHLNRDVAVSPLYGVYKPKNFHIGLLLHYYFQSSFNANHYLRPIVNKGAKNTILISNQGFLKNKVLLPTNKAEQQRFAEILTTQDKLISAKTKLIEAKKRQKQWLMQKLLWHKDWKTVRFKKMFDRLTRKNTVGNTNVMTISAWQGLINQEEYFNKSVSSEDLSGYFLLYKGEFVYNKSYSGNYKFGAFKRLDRYVSGVVSPLYICFAPTFENKCPDFYMHYFESSLLDREIKAIAQEGARNHGLLNIGVNDFFSMRLPIPRLPEQTAIAEILTVADKEIELLTKELEQQKFIKKYLMQQLLTGKKRVKLNNERSEQA